MEVLTPENWADYDVIFIGYPIWWQEAAWPINDFVEENDFSGNTVIPFATSTSSEVAEWLTEIGYESFYEKREQLFILKRNKFWYNTLY